MVKLDLKTSFLRLGYRVSSIIFPRFYALFSGVERNLGKASIRMSYQVYMGLMVFVSYLAGPVAFVVSLILLHVSGFRNTPLVLPALTISGDILWLIVSAGIGVLSCVLSIVIFYAYPMLIVSSRGAAIDGNLPHIANFMSVLASSGMPPEKIYRSLARVGKQFKVEKEAMGIFRDMELRGLDLISALKNAAEKSPSKEFSRLIETSSASAQMGGNLADLLGFQSEKYKKDRMKRMKEFIDNLAIIAETYVTFMVAAPMLLIVMLSVMSFMGGELGSLNPTLLLQLMSFFVLPLGVFFLIMIVDSMSPPR